MKKLTIQEVPDIVVTLGKKIESIELLLQKKKYDHKISYGSQKRFNKEKCCSSFNKSDLAQFFYILMDENILFFDNKRERCNRSKMQLFIEDNFTYNGDEGVQTKIGRISKQFSESKGFTYAEKQLKFLDHIINIFQQRREILLKR